MTPPGLAMVSVSDAAWQAREDATRRGSTSTGSGRARAQETLDAPFTPAVSLVVGLNVALG